MKQAGGSEDPPDLQLRRVPVIPITLRPRDLRGVSVGWNGGRVTLVRESAHPQPVTLVVDRVRGFWCSEVGQGWCHGWNGDRHTRTWLERHLPLFMTVKE